MELKRPHPPEQLPPGVDAGPDGGGVAVVLVDDVAAQVMRALCHRTRVAVHRRLGPKDRRL